MSLTKCIKKMGKLLSAEDAAELRRLQKGFRQDGMSSDDATRAAVQSLMDDAQGERDDLMTRIRAAGGEEERAVEPSRAIIPQKNLIDHRLNPVAGDLREWFGSSKVSHISDGARTMGVVYGVDDTTGLGAKFGTQEQMGAGFDEGVYLRIENPIQLEDVGDWRPMSIAKAAGIDPAVIEGMEDDAAGEEIKRLLKEAGYDGIKYWNNHEGTGFSWIAFDADQIRSLDEGSAPQFAMRPLTDEEISRKEQIIDEFFTLGEYLKGQDPESNGRLKTGVPVTLPYTRWINSVTGRVGVPEEGDPWGRDSEASGEYFHIDKDQMWLSTVERLRGQLTEWPDSMLLTRIERAAKRRSLSVARRRQRKGFGHATGTHTFNNPLVVTAERSGGERPSVAYKRVLSKRFGGETGAELSEAIKDEGYDAILVVDNQGEWIEGINLKSFDKEQAQFSFQPDEGKAPGMAPATIHDETVSRYFTALGNQQRGGPERAMVQAQRIMGGGVMQTAIEHTNDLIHRMTHMSGWPGDDGFRLGIEYVEEKVNRVLSIMNNRYGFEKEHAENMVSNAKYTRTPIEDHWNAVNDALRIMAKEHQKLMVYNYPQWLAREATIALADGRYKIAGGFLFKIKNMIDSPRNKAFIAQASQAMVQDGKLVEYHGPMFKYQRPPGPAGNIEREMPQFSFATTAGGGPQSGTINKAIKPSLRPTSMREWFSEKIDNITMAAAEDRLWGFKQGMFDSAAPVERLEREKFGTLLDAKHSAYKMIGLTKNIGGVMQQVFKTGIPEYRDGQFQIAQDGRKGVVEIFAPLYRHENPDAVTHFEAYAVAKRLHERPDIRHHLTPGEIQELLNMDQQYNGLLGDTLAAWDEVNGQALALAVDRGAISQEMADKWRQYTYVPMYRALEDLEMIDSGLNGPRTRTGLDGQSVTSRRLKGHESARVENVLENMVLNLAKIMDATYKNESMRRIVGLAQGGLMEKLPMRRKAIRLQTEELARALVKGGMVIAQPPANVIAKGSAEVEKWMYSQGVKQVNAMTQEQRESWNTFFRPLAPEGPDIVSVMVKGKPVFYKVNDIPLLRAIQNIGHTQLEGWLGALFRGPRKLLTNMVTLDPGFMAANYIRDVGSTMVAVDHANPWSIMKGTLDSFGDVIGDKGLMDDLRAAGGTTAGWYDPITPNVAKGFGRAVEAAMPFRGATLVNSPRKMIEMYRAIGRTSEMQNRAAVAKSVLAQGGSMSEAAWQAQDVLNFNQRGSWQGTQVIAEVVPFFNARLQGLYKLFFRAATGTAQMSAQAAAQKMFILKGSIMAMASLLYAANMEDDDDYERLPEWDKDTNWHIFTGPEGDRKHWRIPKPFEVGLLFSTFPERLFRNWTGADQDKVTAQSVARGVLDTLAMNPTPQLVKPLYEQWANRSMFTGRPIVNLNLQNLSPEAQYHPWTSATARQIADISANLIPDWAKGFTPDVLESPVRMESMVRAYTGTLGAYVLSASDYLTRQVFDMPEAPSGMVGGSNVFTPVVEGATRRFFRGDPALSRGNKYADVMYESLGKANSLFRTYNQFIKQNEVERAQKLLDSNLNLFTYRGLLNDVNTQLRELNTIERAIRYQGGLDPDEKRGRIEELTRARNQVLQSVAPILDQL